MMFLPGDRVRFESIGEDGFPVVRYGFVGGATDDDGPVTVLLDGELGGNEVDLSLIRPVTITSVELCLAGPDLLTEPDLRRGLVALWHAEADTAGLDVDAMRPLGDGVPDVSGSWALAELIAGGETYVVRAYQLEHEPEVVRVRAGRPGLVDGGIVS